jgi:hypothetical protein
MRSNSLKKVAISSSSLGFFAAIAFAAVLDEDGLRKGITSAIGLLHSVSPRCIFFSPAIAAFLRRSFLPIPSGSRLAGGEQKITLGEMRGYRHGIDHQKNPAALGGVKVREEAARGKRSRGTARLILARFSL